MPTYDACLIDVFGTVLTLDGGLHLAALAERAGVPADEFAAAAEPWGDRVSEGRATVAEAMAAVLAECRVDDAESALQRVLAEDLRIQLELVEVHPDTVPFLEALRAAGVRTAFVSNCADHTRRLLEATGLADRVDHLVLSCEVGAQKPARAIFDAALAALGVPAERAVLIDDLAAYCDAARTLGLGALRIDRTGGEGDVATLAEVLERLEVS